MALRLGDTAPDFEAATTQGPIRFHEWLGDSWGLFLSHPKDFTPVCTTELGLVAQMESHFSTRNTKVLALSLDSLDDHYRWLTDIEETQGSLPRYPIIADSDGSIASLYGMLHPKESNTMPVRSVFVIGPDKKVELSFAYPHDTGRSFDEVLRVLDSLQLCRRHPVATPADWKMGQDVFNAPKETDVNRKPAGTRSCPPAYMKKRAQPGN